MDKNAYAQESATAKPDSGLFQKKPIVYESKGKRDPFIPLKKTARRDVLAEEGGEIFEPDETIRLENYNYVGIINTGKEIIGILEGPGKKIKNVRKGDRVVRGVIEIIDANRIVFRLDEFGRISRKTLEIVENAGNYSSKQSEDTMVLKRPGGIISVQKKPGAQGQIFSDDVKISTANIITLEEKWFKKSAGDEGKDAEKEKKEEVSEKENQEDLHNGGDIKLISPLKGKWKKLPLRLTWSAWNKEDVHYTLILSTNVAFSRSILTVTGITKTEIVLTEKNKLPMNTKLYWKILAEDRDKNLKLSDQENWYFILESPSKGEPK